MAAFPEMAPASPSKTTSSPMVTMTGLSSDLPCRGRIRTRSVTAPMAKPMASTAMKAHQ